MSQVIGLLGYAQAGKDRTADFLVKDFGFTRIAFADALRDAAYATDPWIPLGDGTWMRLTELVDWVGWDEAKKNPEVRRYLQRRGTEGGRDIHGANVWVDLAINKMDASPNTKFVFSDVRFPSEVDAIKVVGGCLWRVLRPGTKPVNEHSSETALDDVLASAIINDGTLDDLREEVKQAYAGLVDCAR